MKGIKKGYRELYFQRINRMVLRKVIHEQINMNVMYILVRNLYVVSGKIMWRCQW